MAHRKYCTTCGDINNGKRKVPGTFLVELALWLLFLFPGLIYSLWRVSSAKRVCRRCESPTLIPLDSPIAQARLGADDTEQAHPREQAAALPVHQKEEGAFSFEAPQVGGENTYDYAESHKHDLEMMVKCCNAELQAYKDTGQVPAPFYFERVAILARKQGRHALEVRVCEQYIRIIEKLRLLPPEHPRKPLIVVDHMADKFKQRLPKAKELLEKQKAESGS